MTSGSNKLFADFDISITSSQLKEGVLSVVPDQRSRRDFVEVAADIGIDRTGALDLVLISGNVAIALNGVQHGHTLSSARARVEIHDDLVPGYHAAPAVIRGGVHERKAALDHTFARQHPLARLVEDQSRCKGMHVIASFPAGRAPPRHFRHPIRPGAFRAVKGAELFLEIVGQLQMLASAPAGY